MKHFFSTHLSHCDCCPRCCGVDRLAGETGVCGIGARVRVAHYGLHFGEEPPISGSRGSGTIFFAGCNLRCVFCQNHQISQEFLKDDFLPLSPTGLAEIMLELQTRGAHNINLVSPSHVIFQAADAITIAKQKGLRLPVVYNSGAYDSVDALREIRGLVDIYLPDLKYLENAVAKQLSSAADYADVAEEALREMFFQVGSLQTDHEGIATSGILVRHLVLPGHLDNSRSCLRFLAKLSPSIPVSLMSQYAPRHRALELPGMDRALSAAEYAEITSFALELGLENAFIQELTSQSTYVPNFDLPRPFDPIPTTTRR